MIIHVCNIYLFILFLSFFSKVATRPVSPRMIMFWTVLWKFVNPIVMLIIFLGAMFTELINPLQYVAYDVSKNTVSHVYNYVLDSGCI